MLSQIYATNQMGEETILPFGRSSEGFYVYYITGLGPTDANLVFSEYANLHGSRYESSRKRNRSIIISIGLDPDYVTTTPESSRNHLYRYFMTGEQVDLVFQFTNGTYRNIKGYVEAFEDDRFSTDLSCKISIICPDPFFYGLEPEDVPGNIVVNGQDTIFEYEGNQPTGLLFTFMPSTSIGMIQITMEQSLLSKQQLEFITPISPSDTVKISTSPGRKDARVQRLGIDLPMLARVSQTSTWPMIKPGKNKLRINTDTEYQGQVLVQYLSRWDAI